MPRSPRICYPGALYHVITRGVDRQPVFRDRADRRRFLDYLTRVIRRYGWRCHAYCLMTTHYHLVVETLPPTISPGMQVLNGRYAWMFNRIHGRKGHLWEERFKGPLLLREEHLLETSRYVVLNPVRAGICAFAGDWPWSSYSATAGEAAPPVFLTTAWLLEQFASDRREAQARYRGFVLEGMLSGLLRAA